MTVDDHREAEKVVAVGIQSGPRSQSISEGENSSSKLSTTFSNVKVLLCESVCWCGVSELGVEGVKCLLTVASPRFPPSFVVINDHLPHARRVNPKKSFSSRRLWRIFTVQNCRRGPPLSVLPSLER